MAAHRGPGFRVQNRRGLERKIFFCDCADPTTGMYAHTWSSPKGEATWREHSEVSLQTPDDQAAAAKITIDQWHPVQNREINQSMNQIAPSCMMNQSLHHRARETLGSRVMEGPWHPNPLRCSIEGIDQHLAQSLCGWGEIIYCTLPSAHLNMACIATAVHQRIGSPRCDLLPCVSCSTPLQQLSDSVTSVKDR